VQVNPLPDAQISGSQVDCVDPYGTVYSATAMNNVYYQWSAFGGSLVSGNGQNNSTIIWNESGIGMVNLLTINTATGCRSNTMLQVMVDSMPEPQITANNFSGCAPMTATFSSNPVVTSYSYQWYFGDGGTSMEALPAHEFHLPGSYPITLIATNNNGCWDTVQSQVLVYNAPVANFDMNVHDDFYPTEETTFSLVNTSAGGVQYLWDFGDGNLSTEFEPAHHYPGAGTYQIELITTNQHGCKDSTTATIEIRVPQEIYVPSAFTPNGDSRNDGFSIAGRNITELTVTIFDRWGEAIYTSNKPDFVWDGTYFGHHVQEGVYVYKIEAKGVHGKWFERIGTVSLVR
jgi:gliding motility-associated-like protein